MLGITEWGEGTFSTGFKWTPTGISPFLVNYHDDIYGPEVHEVGPHVVSCMLYIQVIAKA